MAKLSHQTQPPPVDALDAATKFYVDESGAGAARGDFIEASMSVDQTVAWAADTVVLFDTAVRSRGALTVNGSGRFSGLKAGRTYFLIGSVQIADGGARTPWKWYDVTNGVAIGSSGVSISPNTTSATGYIAPTTALISPSQDIEVEFRCAAAPFPAGSWTAQADNGWSEHTSVAQIIEIGAVQADVIGGLEYMDTIVVGADTTSVTFGTGGDGLLGRALDGDVDEVYEIHALWIPPASAAVNMTIRPNGISTNQQTAWNYHTGSTNSSNQVSALILARTDSTTGVSGFSNGTLWAKTGSSRLWTALESVQNTGADVRGRVHTGVWNESATNITSLDIVSALASGIKAGSVFRLFRRTSNNVRADSTSTYERNVEATVSQGTNSEVEYTTGHASRQGSAIAVSVSLNDTVTAGSITVNLKVAGSTVLTTTLDTTDTSFNRALESVGVHAVAPGDEIIVGISTTGLTTTGGGSPGITVNSMLVADGLVSQLTDVVAETTLSSASNTISVDGLDGDAHGVYEIDVYLLLSDTGTPTIDLNPNGGAPSSIRSRYYENYGGATVITDDIQLVGAHTSFSGRELHGRILSHVARTQGGVAKKRTFVSELVSSYDATPFNSAYNSHGSWGDATSNMTSLEIVTDVASGFLAGSRVTVRRT